jgi:hypothetical protein
LNAGTDSGDVIQELRPSGDDSCRERDTCHWYNEEHPLECSELLRPAVRLLMEQNWNSRYTSCEVKFLHHADALEGWGEVTILTS